MELLNASTFLVFHLLFLDPHIPSFLKPSGVLRMVSLELGNDLKELEQEPNAPVMALCMEFED